jgi:hypothetical protein
VQRIATSAAVPPLNPEPEIAFIAALCELNTDAVITIYP